ncbi:LacI family DNA-binding transcriptional regulator [Kineococcus sp. NPDC059986]|uniref:LacI family DNA-binding transcriptional regulator n=1 Tax=Kineococcus sp. NPDC059986 TaxID=3155538 RepID=UPI00344B636D
MAAGAARGKPATIYDVAELAGVSHITVSRFLSGFSGMRAATRERVAAAVAELDYTPNPMGRSLRLQRIDRIAYLADRLDEYGPSQLLLGALSAARARGYILDVVPTGEGVLSVDAAVDLVGRERVAGIVLSGRTEPARSVLTRRAFSVPVVEDFELHVAGTSTPVDEWVGQIAAEHLLAQGHRRVALLEGPAAWAASSSRAGGFRAALARGGGSVLVVETGDWSPRSGYEATTRMLSAGLGDATALGVANDAMALGALSALFDAGIRVPEDLAVIGVDDLPQAAYARPGLSTVAVDHAAEGRHVVDALVDRIEGVAPPGVPSQVPAPLLVVRGSTTRA